MKKNTNRIILISNIKGGVGKTTLCSVFASYLVAKGYPLIVFDADIQESLLRHRKRELDADGEATPSFDIGKLDTLDRNALEDSIKKLKSIPGTVLIDCPGNLNDDNLSLLFAAADYIIVPMAYDQDTVDATGIFVKVIKKNFKAKFIFIPNLIDDREGRAAEKEQREETIHILGKIGLVTPRIKRGVAVKRYSTIYPLDSFQTKAVEHAFDAAIKEMN